MTAQASGEKMTLNDRTIDQELTVTERAAKRIAKVLADEQPGTALRITISGGGCSGFQYHFDFDHKCNDDDFVLTRGDATIVVDSLSLNYLRGSEIDFVDDLIGQSFQINNPNATASCGCGTSFSI